MSNNVEMEIHAGLAAIIFDCTELYQRSIDKRAKHMLPIEHLSANEARRNLMHKVSAIATTTKVTMSNRDAMMVLDMLPTLLERTTKQAERQSWSKSSRALSIAGIEDARRIFTTTFPNVAGAPMVGGVGHAQS